MIIKAPWTEEQVKMLNLYQTNCLFHPYTCGNGSHTLTATRDGWICEECQKNGTEYKQDWCLEGSIIMAETREPRWELG